MRRRAPAAAAARREAEGRARAAGRGAGPALRDRMLAAGLVAAVLGPGAAAAQTRVVIGHGAQSTGVVPLWVAAENGYFRKHGIEADLRFIRGGSVTTAALLSGQASLAVVALSQVVGPVSRGADLVAVATLVDKLPYRFVVSPRIRRPEDLKDRKVGLATLSGATYVATRMALEQLGLDPKRDRIWLVPIGTEPERLAALAAGSVDAAMMTPSAAARLPATEYRTLVDLRAANLPWIHLCLLTTRTFLRASPNLADGALRALAEGAAFALDPGNREAVKAIIGRTLKLGNAAALEDSYRDVVDDVAWPPVPDLVAAATVLKVLAEVGVMAEAARLQPLDIVDPAPMLRLEREGWLDHLRPRR